MSILTLVKTVLHACALSMEAAQEYAENRSITSVVPVDNPLTTNEPELLQMSPEQAEDTQL